MKMSARDINTRTVFSHGKKHLFPRWKGVTVNFHLVNNNNHGVFIEMVLLGSYLGESEDGGGKRNSISATYLLVMPGNAEYIDSYSNRGDREMNDLYMYVEDVDLSIP